MKKVLVIDDDPVCRDIACAILAKRGFEPFTADNGEDGIALAKEIIPDAVLCDIMMPEMNGHEVLDRFAKEPSIANIPFIFVTALNSSKDIRLGMTAGADDYITKPYEIEELVSAINTRLCRVEGFKAKNHSTTFSQEVEQIKMNITGRELEILLMVGKGLTSNEIALKLNIKCNTVEVHRANLMKKLNAANAASLSRWAVIAEMMK